MKLTTFEEEVKENFKSIFVPDDEGDWDDVWTFLLQALRNQRLMIVKEVEGMKYSNDGGLYTQYNQAISDILLKLKGNDK
jgi:hypothetical protein